MTEKEIKTCVELVVTYKSGRTEHYHGKLRKNGTPYKRMADKEREFSLFPTVVKTRFIAY